jgi:hypothetical protein
LETQSDFKNAEITKERKEIHTNPRFPVKVNRKSLAARRRKIKERRHSQVKNGRIQSRKRVYSMYKMCTHEV